VKRFVFFWVIPTLRLSKFYKVGRATIILMFTVDGVCWEVLNIARIGNSNVIRAHTFSSPVALIPGKLNEDPAFIFIGQQVRVSAVGGVPVLTDPLPQYSHRFFRCGRTFHGNARKIRLLRSGL